MLMCVCPCAPTAPTRVPHSCAPTRVPHCPHCPHPCAPTAPTRMGCAMRMSFRRRLARSTPLSPSLPLSLSPSLDTPTWDRHPHRGLLAMPMHSLHDLRARWSMATERASVDTPCATPCPCAPVTQARDREGQARHAIHGVRGIGHASNETTRPACPFAHSQRESPLRTGTSSDAVAIPCGDRARRVPHLSAE
jgi:hypothetical protein